MPLENGQVLDNRYRIEEALGAGGMGTVYRAIDLRFEADVALKENRLATPESQNQFVREARLLYRLRHPNLPRVIDHFAVEDQGQYLIMDYIEGKDLDQILIEQAGPPDDTHADQSQLQRGPLPQAQALAWISLVLDALVYLHGEEVIHRDVKPSNVRITSRGEVLLVDFGLAKEYDPEQLTTIGARGVTPGYAPPEQYGHGRTDARTDVYSAGATLYALLTGLVPPDALDIMIRRAVLVPLDEEVPDLLPGVGEAVVRAMQSAPDDRFQTAAAFREALLEALAMADLPLEVPESASQPPDLPPEEAAPVEQRAATPSREQPAPESADERPTLLRPLPRQELKEPEVEDNARTRLGPTAEPEHALLPRIITPENAGGVAQLVQWEGDEVECVTFSPNGDLLAAATRSGILLYDTGERKPVRKLARGVRATSLSFSLDGATLAAGSRYQPARLWSVATGQITGSLGLHTIAREGLAFSPIDSSLVAAAGWDHIVRLLRVSDGRVQARLQAHTASVEALTFSPDGTLLATGSRDHTIGLWRTSDGQMLHILEGHTGAVLDLAFSPNGAALASGSNDHSVRLWRANSGASTGVLRVHTGPVAAVAFSPNGMVLASGSHDGSLRLWQADRGRSVGRLVGHKGHVRAVAFSPSGAQIASGSRDGTVRLCGIPHT